MDGWKTPTEGRMNGWMERCACEGNSEHNRCVVGIESRAVGSMVRPARGLFQESNANPSEFIQSERATDEEALVFYFAFRRDWRTRLNRNT